MTDNDKPEQLTFHLETRVTLKFWDRVDALAKQQKRTRAGMVRVLIEAGMDSLEPADEDGAGNKKVTLRNLLHPPTCGAG